MVKHIVMYKLKQPNERNAQQLMQTFMSMKGKIPQLVDIQSGVDILREGRSYDVVLICTFKSLDDLNAYASHEVHLPVKEYVKTVVEKSHSVDFEY